jgi:hypothetical protein
MNFYPNSVGLCHHTEWPDNGLHSSGGRVSNPNSMSLAAAG